MSFFGKYVTDFVKTTISSISPFKVEEVSFQNLNTDYKNYSIMISFEDRFVLYRVANYYEFIFIPVTKDRIDKSKVYSLFRYQGTLSDAKKLHFQYFNVISVLENCIQNDKIDKVWLEKVCSITKTHKNWTAAHIAAHLEMAEAFRSNALSGLINVADKVTGVTPLHLAVSSVNLDLVKDLLLVEKIDLNKVDTEGNSVLHLAASNESPHILNLLLTKSSTCVNYLNTSGRGPLHVACEAKSSACIDSLLRFGADPNFSAATEFPIHVAMRVENMECVKLLCGYFPEQIKAKCPNTGACAIHFVKSKTSLEILMKLGAEINAQNNEGLTCLHLMVKENNFEMVLALLLFGAGTNVTTNVNETPLHLAVKDCDVDLIRALIVFEVNVNALNINKESTRHLLCTSKTSKYNYSKTRDIALYTIHAVGAKRCPNDMNNCTEGCGCFGSFNGKAPTTIHTTVNHAKDVMDETLSEAHRKNVKAPPLMRKRLSEDFGQSQIEEIENPDSDWSYSDIDFPDQNFEKHPGLKILCLDGGGIRGLILTQTLRALERVSGRRIVDMFDWIGGTSTGGLLAISIVYKMDLKDCRIMYMKMKDKIFVGKRPYSTEYLETVVKEQVGENTMMTCVKYPKLTVTGLLCDRFPPKLHLFRNYDPPLSSLKSSLLLKHDESDKNTLESSKPSTYGTHDASSFSKGVKHPSEQLVWETAKATGAAPTFFRSCGPFLDGGLIANNPTLDIITEIFEYNLVKKHNNTAEEPLGIVVSLGTGRIPITPMSSVDVFRPNNPIDVYNIVQGMSSLTKILVEMATISEGRVVDRARAWCGSLGVPFFRFSPPLSSDTNLDEVDNTIILQMLWDTECYLFRSQDRLKKLADLL